MSKGGRPKGLPKTGGRKAGTPNRANIPGLREAAGAYTIEAVETLAAIMRNTKAPHLARVRAAAELLDRGHGRPTQDVSMREELTIVNPRPLTLTW